MSVLFVLFVLFCIIIIIIMNLSELILYFTLRFHPW